MSLSPCDFFHADFFSLNTGRETLAAKRDRRNRNTAKNDPARGDELHRRLVRLGLTTARDMQPKPRIVTGRDIADLVDGEVTETTCGACFRVRHVYPLDTRHGDTMLGRWHDLAAEVLSHLGADPELEAVNPVDMVFLDTETTGLGGTGTLAFEVGIAYFDDEGLTVEQYFLREPGEEPAMLALLEDRLAPGTALVTFNGRGFDVPLLASRWVMNRRPPLLDALPNLDLLMPARRLWSMRLPSRRLSALEPAVLGVHRTDDDVPGHLIPALYNQYLRTRDASSMQRVLYHNEIDLLSMVTLGVHLADAFATPDNPAHPFEDRFSLARWYVARGLNEQAEIAYRLAAEQAEIAEWRQQALTGWALLLKRTDRRDEARPLWEDIADLRLDVQGHEELAKYYEWHRCDLDEALHWTEAGLRLAASWRPGWARTQAEAALQHRRERLLRRLADGGSAEDRALEE